MSTDWYFECLSHTPAISSEAEFTQHTGDSFYKEALELARHRPLDISVQDVIDDDNLRYFERNSRIFLIQHEACEIGIVNEYGDHLTLDEATPPEEKSDKPLWYRETSRGSVVQMCVMCIRMDAAEVLPSVAVEGGISVCHRHVMARKYISPPLSR